MSRNFYNARIISKTPGPYEAALITDSDAFEGSKRLKLKEMQKIDLEALSH